MKRSAVEQFDQSDQKVGTQYAALCWRMGKKGAEVLLITSRETGRWVLPKGWPIGGLSPSEAAKREAWEEAGVDGKASPDCLGLFSYDKVIDRSCKALPSHPCVVAVYPLQVTKLSNEFPEHRQRSRKWYSPKDAARKVEETELKTLLIAFGETMDQQLDPKPAKPQKGKTAKT